MYMYLLLLINILGAGLHTPVDLQACRPAVLLPLTPGRLTYISRLAGVQTYSHPQVCKPTSLLAHRVPAQLICRIVQSCTVADLEDIQEHLQVRVIDSGEIFSIWKASKESKALIILAGFAIFLFILKFCYRDHMSEYPQALKVREEKLIDSDEPASKKPRISSYPKLLFDKLWEMTDPVTKVCYSL